MHSPFSVPVELMDILTKINDNVNDVKERVTRIEAQDHGGSIRLLGTDLKTEREERIKLQIEVVNIKSKLAPILVGVSLIGGAIIQIVIKVIAP